ncbi:MAG: DUF4388 domain-containing protein [Acidobacteriota bacterium]
MVRSRRVRNSHTRSANSESAVLPRRNRGFAGAVQLEGLADLVQIFTNDSATGSLRLRRENDSGEVWFEKGQIVHAVCGDSTGEPAVSELMAWRGGDFDFEPGAEPPDKTIEGTWQDVLLGACQQLDEARHGEALAESLETEDPLRPDSVSGEPSRSRQSGSSTASAQPSANVLQGRWRHRDDRDTVSELTQANAEALRRSLRRISQVDGFLAVCVVDRDLGRIVELENRFSTLDLRVAAAGTATLVRAELKTLAALGSQGGIEEILITLGQQYHLVRPLSHNQRLLIYLLLDKHRGNLAMARLELSQTEETIVF